MITSARHPQWDKQLAAVTKRHLKLPGVWGMADCLMTVADAIDALIGVDLAEGVRGTYDTEEGAAVALEKRGYADLEAYFIDNFPKIGRLAARRGDVVLLETQGILAAGYICEYGAAVKMTRGLVFRPQTDIIRAFKIG